MYEIYFYGFILGYILGSIITIIVNEIYDYGTRKKEKL